MPIVWLASYPKSGNTWVRAFLANLATRATQPVSINRLPDFAFGENHLVYFQAAAGGAPVDGTDDRRIQALRAAAQAALDASAPGPKFVKTHNAIRRVHGQPTISPAVTAGAVYILRNPLDVVVSYADHMGYTLDRTIQVLADDTFAVSGSDSKAFQFLGHWSIHVRSWTEAKGLRVHVLRYEDLAAQPLTRFRALARFLHLPSDQDSLRRAIAFSSFDTLSAQEQAESFVERSRHSRAFFRQGQVGGWRQVLSPAQVAQVIADHREVMARFGYLDKLGRPQDR